MELFETKLSVFESKVEFFQKKWSFWNKIVSFRKKGSFFKKVEFLKQNWRFSKKKWSFFFQKSGVFEQKNCFLSLGSVHLQIKLLRNYWESRSAIRVGHFKWWLVWWNRVKRSYKRHLSGAHSQITFVFLVVWFWWSQIILYELLRTSWSEESDRVISTPVTW